MQTNFAQPHAPRPRSDDVRERMIDVAARLFASRGYAGVSVRAIAQAADANIAAVSYHFGGKRGLYLAALERLMEEMRPIGGPVIERINAAFEAGRPDRATLAEVATFVVSHILETMLAGDMPPWAQQTVLREFQEPTPDYRPMLDERVLPLHRAIRRLAAASLEIPVESTGAVLAAHAVMGQIMVFAAARTVALEELGWSDFTAGRVGQVIDAALPAVLGALRLPPPQRPSQGSA